MEDEEVKQEPVASNELLTEQDVAANIPLPVDPAIDEEEPLASNLATDQASSSSNSGTPVLQNASLIETHTNASSPVPMSERLSQAATLPKKFASSLSVSKKFLEKAGTTDSVKTGTLKSPLNATARASTPTGAFPSSKSPVPSGPTLNAPSIGPRLLSGKINTQPFATLGSAAQASSGWGKTGETKVNGGPLTAQLDFMGGGVPTNAGRGRGRGLSRDTRSGQPWASSNDRSQSNTWSISEGDFPSVAEAAKSQQLKARAMVAALAAKEAKDKKSQQIAAEAAEAYRKHLMEDLDAFRGVHLDPNVAHWDEMDDDDFGDVVDFGDGVKIEIPTDLEHLQQADEKFAESQTAMLDEDRTTEKSQPSLQLRHEFDRGEVDTNTRSGGRSLFNDRLGRFELYARPSPQSVDATKGGPVIFNAKHQSSRVESQQKRDSHNQYPAQNKANPTSPSIEQRGRDILPVSSQLRQVSQERPRRPAPSPSVNPWNNPSKAHPLPMSATPGHPSEPASQPEVPVSSVDGQPVQSTSIEPVIDVNSDEYHKKEMHARAEQARERRLKEETERLAQQERARKKAQEIEDKIKLQAAAKQDAEREAKARASAEKEAAAQAAAQERIRQRSEERARRPQIPATTSSIVASQLEALHLPIDSSNGIQSAQAAPIFPPTGPRSESKQQDPNRRKTGAEQKSTLNGSQVQKTIKSPDLKSATSPPTSSRSRFDATARLLSNALSPTSASQDISPTLSKAEESHNWRRTTPVEKQPRARKASPSSATGRPSQHSENLARTEESSRPPKPRTVSFVALHDVPEVPTVKLSADQSLLPSAHSQITPKQGLSSLDDALSRLRGALQQTKEQRKIHDEVVDRNIQSEYRIPVVDLSAQEIDLAVTVVERPSSPKPTTAWKVFPRIKVNHDGREVIDVPKKNFNRAPRFDSPFIVTWHMSKADRLRSNLFREYLLFPAPAKELTVHLPGQVKKTSTLVGLSASQELEGSETAENLIDTLDAIAEHRVMTRQGIPPISVVLPRSSLKKGMRIIPSVRLPGARQASKSAVTDVVNSVVDSPLPSALSSMTAEDLDQSPEAEFEYVNSNGLSSVSSDALPTASNAMPVSFDYGQHSSVPQSWIEANTLKVVKSVWEQPSPIDTKASNQSSSVLNNSLKDLVDDFPNSLPTMNDLRSEDGHGSDGPEYGPEADPSQSMSESLVDPTSLADLPAVVAENALAAGYTPNLSNNMPLPGVKQSRQLWTMPRGSSHGSMMNNQSQSAAFNAQHRPHTNQHQAYNPYSFYVEAGSVPASGTIWTPHTNNNMQYRNAPVSAYPTSPAIFQQSPVYQHMPLYQPQMQPGPNARLPPNQVRPSFYPSQSSHEYVMAYPTYPVQQQPQQQVYPTQGRNKW